MAIAGSIGDIAVMPNGRTVFATGWDAELGGVVHVIDVAGARVTDTIGVGGMPTQLVLGRGGDWPTSSTATRSPCCAPPPTRSSTASSAGPQLSCLAATRTDRLYVADYAGAITVLQSCGTDSAAELMTAELPQLAAAAS